MQRSKMYLDCDGVLLDWVRPFLAYTLPHMKYEELKHYSLSPLFGGDMEKTRELVDEFNHSVVYKSLKPLTSRERLLQLEKAGYDLHIITQVDGEKAREARIRNIENCFGLGLFKKVICTSHKENKVDVLRKIEPYDLNLHVIEDNPAFFPHADCDGYITAYAISHSYNCKELKSMGIPSYLDINELIRCLCNS